MPDPIAPRPITPTRRPAIDRSFIALATVHSLPQNRPLSGDAREAPPSSSSPLRNIAPCISCHGDADQKLGAPWIEGMPKAYLVAQLDALRSGERHNDAEAQMRAMARPMTDREIDEVATFYARKAAPAGVQGH
jgi:cytochrome c553